MTVLMTQNQRYPLAGSRCRIEWQGLGPDDEVNARLTSEQGPTIVFPREPVTGLRPQPHAPRGARLLDLTAGAGRTRRTAPPVGEPANARALPLPVGGR